jgi:hypothetical protein
MWRGDESATGSVNSFWSARSESAERIPIAEVRRALKASASGPQLLGCVVTALCERFHPDVEPVIPPEEP